MLPASGCPVCAAPWQEVGNQRHHGAVCFASLQSATAGREPRLGQPAEVLCSLFLSPQQPLAFMGTMGWCDWSLRNTNSPLRLSQQTGSTDSPRIEIQSSLCSQGMLPATSLLMWLSCSAPHCAPQAWGFDWATVTRRSSPTWNWQAGGFWDVPCPDRAGLASDISYKDGDMSGGWQEPWEGEQGGDPGFEVRSQGRLCCACSCYPCSDVGCLLPELQISL